MPTMLLRCLLVGQLVHVLVSQPNGPSIPPSISPISLDDYMHELIHPAFYNNSGEQHTYDPLNPTL